MGRPLGTKNNMRTPEEKEKIIFEYKNGRVGLRVICRDYGIDYSTLRKWIKQYDSKNLSGLKSQTGKKSGFGTGRPKNTSTEEEKLKREIAKLEIENARLKKGYQVKGVGVQKEYVTTFDVNTK